MLREVVIAFLYSFISARRKAFSRCNVAILAGQASYRVAVVKHTNATRRFGCHSFCSNQATFLPTILTCGALLPVPPGGKAWEVEEA